MSKKIILQSTFEVTPDAYKRLVLSSLSNGLKPSVSGLLKKIIENSTEKELTQILSR